MEKEKYIKEQKITERTDKEKEIEIIQSLIKTKMDLDAANKNYEQAEDELIDYYVYQIKANQAKLDYLVKRAKNQKIVLKMIDAIEYRIIEVS